MAKRNVNKFLEECIELCWVSQRTLIDDTCEDYKILSAKVEAFQEVYAHLNDGEEYDGGSEVLDDDRPSLDEAIDGKAKPAPVPVVDDEDEEEDGESETEEDE